MHGLAIRIARGLNALWNREGTPFEDRFHLSVAQTYAEVFRVMRYVLHNGLRHGRVRRGEVDPFSSGPWYEG